MSTSAIKAPAAHMAKLIAELREPLTPGSIRTLSTTDPLYEEPTEVRTVPADELRPNRVPELRDALADGADTWSQFVRLYNLDGERLPSWEGDWDGMLATLQGPRGPIELTFRSTANAVALHNDMIYVSDGQHLVTAVEIDANGVEQFTFLSLAGLRKREREERAAEVAHLMPVAQAGAPSWADPLTPEDFNLWANNETEVVYTGPLYLTNGMAHLNQLGDIDATGNLTFKDAPSVYINVEENAKWTPALVRELAAELLAFANHFESAIGAK